MWLLLAFLLDAHAEMPLPSYRDELVREKWHEVNELLESGRLDEAIARAEAFERHVAEAGSLAYLIGLAHRVQGRNDDARDHYERALALDPTLAEAWYDVGEIYVLERRLDDAERAFTKVTELVPEGDKSWYGPWRLAEVAAHKRDAAAFEQHMREALERGFSFRAIGVQDLANWHRFYADPALRDSIDKLLTVYSDPQTLESFRRAAEASAAPDR